MVEPKHVAQIGRLGSRVETSGPARLAWRGRCCGLLHRSTALFHLQARIACELGVFLHFGLLESLKLGRLELHHLA